MQRNPVDAYRGVLPKIPGVNLFRVRKELGQIDLKCLAGTHLSDHGSRMKASFSLGHKSTSI